MCVLLKGKAKEIEYPQANSRSHTSTRYSIYPRHTMLVAIVTVVDIITSVSEVVGSV